MNKGEVITVKVSKKNSMEGKRYAKKFGGKFDAETQTWEIPANRPEISDLEAYYLVRVDNPHAAVHGEGDDEAY